MNQTNKSALVQALGFGLASAAAATLASRTAKRARPSFSPLGFLSRKRGLQNPFARKTLAGALLSTPLLSNLIGGRSVKRDLLRSALLGVSAGVGSLAMPQRRGVWGARGGRAGSGLTTVGRLLAGGLIAAAASKLLGRKSRDQYAHEEHTHESRTRGRQAQEQSGV
jgi:hypothetical protein